MSTMSLMKSTCSHGTGWGEKCAACDRVWDQEQLTYHQNKVEHYSEKLGQVGQKLSLPLRRMWINAPSTSQIYHPWDRLRVLAAYERPGIARIYFVSGDCVSMEIESRFLDDGWPEFCPTTRA